MDGQCDYYADFMRNLNRPTAEGLYWTFFTSVLFLLFSTSWKYGRAMENTEGMGSSDRERERLLRKCFWYCLICAFIAMACAILEVFCILTLQFCDREPLISLYWSTWTVLQVGGVVAIFGISLHIRHMIKGRKHPPWALALGTPVLVVAGLGHYLQGKVKSKTRDIRSISRESRRRSQASGLPLSEAPTVRNDSTDRGDRSHSIVPKQDNNSPTFGNIENDFNAKVVGYTEEGDVIIKLSPEVQKDLGLKPRPQSNNDSAWNNSKLEVDDTQRTTWSRQRSSSSVTFKGKEKEISINHKENLEEDRETVVNDSDQENTTSEDN